EQMPLMAGRSGAAAQAGVETAARQWREVGDLQADLFADLIPGHVLDGGVFVIEVTVPGGARDAGRGGVALDHQQLGAVRRPDQDADRDAVALPRHDGCAPLGVGRPLPLDCANRDWGSGRSVVGRVAPRNAPPRGGEPRAVTRSGQANNRLATNRPVRSPALIPTSGARPADPSPDR